MKEQQVSGMSSADWAAHWLPHIFAQVGDAIVLQDERGLIIEWNAAAERITGWRREQVLGQPSWDVLAQLLPEALRGPDSRARLRATQLHLLQTGQAPHAERPLEVLIQRADGQIRALEEIVFTIRTSQGFQAGSIIRDVTDRRRLAERERDYEHLLELLARGADLSQVLATVAGWVERYATGSLCMIHVIDATRQRLELGAAPSMASPHVQTMRDLSIAAQLGVCGQAAVTGRRVVVEDMQTDPSYAGLRDVVQQLGLRSGWAEPSLTSIGEVLGTVSVCYREPHQPTPDELQLVKSAADLVKVAIERKRSDDALKVSEARWRSLVENASAVITLVGPDGTIQWINDTYAGQSLREAQGRRVYDYLPIDDHDRVRTLLDQVFSTGQSQLYESEYSVPDGMFLSFDHRVSPLKQDDQIVAALVLSTEISARKQAEAALRDGEAKYHAFFEAELDAIFLVDQADGQILDANRSAARQYGYTREQLLNMTLFDLSAEPDITRRDLQLSSLYAPLRYHRKLDGSVFPAEITTNSFVWQMRSVVMVAVRDIAERQRAEDALKQRNRELAMLNRAAQALTSTLNLSEVLELVLDELRRMLDVSASSIWLLDSETHELVCRQATGPHSEAVRGWHISLERGIVGWTAKHDQSVIIPDTRHDDRHFPGVDQSTGMVMRSIVSVPLRAQNEVIGVIQAVDELPGRFDASTLRLIELLSNTAAIAVENARLYEQTQRYTTELQRHVGERTQELQHERARLQAVFDSAGEGIQIMDCDFVITYCNPATEAITGYTTAEITGHPSRLIVSGQLSGSLPTDLRRTLEQGQVWRGELVSRRKDGSAFDLAVTVSPLRDQSGEITGYVSVHRDISHLKELDRLRNQFVSRIGHELRTPLTSLIIYLDLLEHGKPEKHAQYLSTLHHEADRLRRLIEGFLKMAEIDASRLAIELTAANLNQLAGEIIHQHRAQAEQRQLQLTFEPETAMPMAVLDVDLTQDIVRRVVDNALNYTPAGGHIGCTTAIRNEDGQAWITFTVLNDGEGLSPEEMPRLFERFYRGRAARNYTVPGVGLSLAICREAIAKMGGRITAEITPEKLTAFTLWFLAAPAA